MSSVVTNVMTGVMKMVAVAAVVVLAGVQTGCTSKPKMGVYTIEVSLAPDLATGAGVPTIPVDIIGVQQVDEATWNQTSLNDYFAASNPFRMAANRHSMNFGPGDTATETLRWDDARWNSWKGAQNLYIVADLPGAGTDMPGAADPRRRIIPLDTRYWGGTRKVIQIQVQRGALVVLTEMKPLPN